MNRRPQRLVLLLVLLPGFAACGTRNQSPTTAPAPVVEASPIPDPFPVDDPVLDLIADTSPLTADPKPELSPG